MDITLALQFCRPGAQWRVGEDYASLQWDEPGLPKPTEEELQQAWLDYLAQPPPVPEISNAQMRLWLIEHGYYTTVTGYINGIADPTQRLKAQTEFQARNTIQRGHPLVAVIAGVLGLDAAATDQAFREAALL